MTGEQGEPGRFDATKITDAELEWLSQNLNRVKEQALMAEWGDDVPVLNKQHRTRRMNYPEDHGL